MRRRLTAAFLLLTLFVVAIFAIVRFYTFSDMIRAQEADHLDREVTLMAQVVADRGAGGGVVDHDFLAPLLDEMQQVEVTYDGREIAAGSTGGPSADDLVARASSGETRVTLSQADDIVGQRLRSNRPQLALTSVILILLAGAVGYWMSGTLVKPFRDLAVAARALGRGRFDLALPAYSVPEAEGIARALRASAGQIEESLNRDRRFVHHASHVLRTPLTGLRLELDDLSQRDDLPDDVHEAAERCLAKVAQLDSEIDGLIDLSRAAGPGIEVSLELLARQVAQQWTEELSGHGRGLRATVDGDLELALVPGPIEQLLDEMLTDVVARGSGQVSVGFEGLADQLRIRVQGGSAKDQSGASADSRVGHEFVDRLGGRISGDVVSAQGLEILLPVR